MHVQRISSIIQKILFAYREIFFSALNSYFNTKQMRELQHQIQQQKIEIIQLRQEIQRDSWRPNRPWNHINWLSVVTTTGPPIEKYTFQLL